MIFQNATKTLRIFKKSSRMGGKNEEKNFQSISWVDFWYPKDPISDTPPITCP